MTVRGTAVLMVDVDLDRVEQALRAGRLACPGCTGALRAWGWARARTLRGMDTQTWLRPRRARCACCQATHVLLPVVCLARRVDLVEVVGQALLAKAAGLGHRPIAVRLQVPATTVRGWLRRFAGRAEQIREHFTRLAWWLEPDQMPWVARGSPWADALEAIGKAAAGAVRRLGPGGGPWTFASGASGGRLLSNTTSPFPAPW